MNTTEAASAPAPVIAAMVERLVIAFTSIIAADQLLRIAPRPIATMSPDQKTCP